MVGKHAQVIPASTEYEDTKEIFYGRIFSRVPTVVTAIAGFIRGPIAADKDGYILRAEASEAATNKFNLLMKATDVQIRRLEVTWIACA